MAAIWRDLHGAIAECRGATAPRPSAHPLTGLAALIGATADGPALTDGPARASVRTRRS